MTAGLVGTVIKNRYSVERHLGEGGMGVVYLARDRELHSKPVVIKVLLGEWSHDHWGRAKFHQEIEALSRLDHPNIVQVLDSGQLSDGSPFIVMQYIEGSDVASVIDAELLEFNRIANILVQCGGALDAAHQKGVFHRDLKPHNIMLQRLSDGGEVARIIDFGIAKVKESEVAGSTTQGIVAGTLLYMAPEQLAHRVSSELTDIWSLGVIAYEMVTGYRPFRARTETELLEQQKTGPIAPSRLCPELTNRAEQIILKALAFDPSSRFRKASEFAETVAVELRSVKRDSLAARTRPIARKRLLSKAVAAGALVILLLSGATFWILSKHAGTIGSSWGFRQISTGDVTVTGARFSVDGGAVYVSANWEGNPVQINRRSIEDESSFHSTQWDNGDLAGVSRNNILIARSDGTLVKTSVSGGKEDKIADDFIGVDLSFDGKVALARRIKGQNVVEFPAGQVVYKSKDPITSLRFSHNAGKLAFIEGPEGSGEQEVVIISNTGAIIASAKGWWIDPEAASLVWNWEDDEVWFQGSKDFGEQPSVQTISTSGKERTVARLPGNFALKDMSPQGLLLAMEAGDPEMIVYGHLGGEESERVLLSLKRCRLRALSDDGRTLIYDRSGAYALTAHSTDGRYLTSKSVLAISPDGESVLAGDQNNLFVLRMQGGEPERLPFRFAGLGNWGQWTKQGPLFLLAADTDGHDIAVHEANPSGSFKTVMPQGIEPEGPVSPDGTRLVGCNDVHKCSIYDTESGVEVSIPLRGLKPVQWSADGRSLIVYQRNTMPSQVSFLVIDSQESAPWKEIKLPPNTFGITAISDFLMTPDTKSYAYSFERRMDRLYLIQGLK